MKIKVIAILSILLISVISSSHTMGNTFDANEATASKDAIETIAFVEKSSVKGLSAKVDVGKVDGMKNNLIRVILYNETDQDFTLNKARPSCSCTSAKLTSNTFPADSSVTLEIDLKPFKNLNSPNQYTTIHIDTQTGESITIELHLDVQSLVSFHENSMFFELSSSAEDKFVDVPILITSPYRTDSIQFSTKPINVANISVVSVGENHFVRCKIPHKPNVSSNLSFELLAKIDRINVPLSTFCMIEFSRNVSVMPRTQGLQKRTTEATKKEYILSGTALISVKNIDSGKSAEKPEAMAESRVDVSVANIEGWVAESQTIRIGNGRYRCHYKLIPDSKDSIPPKSISFDIRTPSEMSTIECPAIVR